MFKVRYSAVTILILFALVGYFVWTTTGTDGRFDFKLGLDLSGGTHLVYSADISKVPAAEVQDALASLREVIERRVNAFGVGEPVVQTQQGGALGTGEHRLVVELPGITDTQAAIKSIGETPLLEFKLVKAGQEGNLVDAQGNPVAASFEDTGLTGKFLSRASLQF